MPRAPMPRRRVNPALAQAVHASGTPKRKLGLLAGYPRGADLGAVLYDQTVIETDTNLARLRCLAALVGFEGPLLLEGEA